MKIKVKGDLLKVDRDGYHKEQKFGIYSKEVGRHDTVEMTEKIVM